MNVHNYSVGKVAKMQKMVMERKNDLRKKEKFVIISSTK